MRQLYHISVICKARALAPLHAHREDIEKYRGRYRCGWDEIRKQRHETLKGAGLLDPKWDVSPRDRDACDWANAPHREWESMRMATYAAMVECMDRNIGRIVDTLTATGRIDNTLILFISDNGGCAELLKENGWKEREINVMRDGRAIRFGNRPELEPGEPDTFMSYDLPWANASNSPFRLFKHWVHEGGNPTIWHRTVPRR